MRETSPSNTKKKDCTRHHRFHATTIHSHEDTREWNVLSRPSNCMTTTPADRLIFTIRMNEDNDADDKTSSTGSSSRYH
ncbi:hypothetical protein LSH36_26g11020 [Paralvinella palmiformis]|uniref:Uncharacterized protein n=1 Tax=Paralvinella palmiformis TaxID=53620 RepID=A0AAD9NES4_9ANNE|nr:hypothetical protein LSH36_26g11020 [Paralvinella palmiformis]